MSDPRHDLLNSIDIEWFCQHENLDYKVTHGASGKLLNLKECPSCGDRRSRTYVNVDNGLGHCFVCEAGWNKRTFFRAVLGLNGFEFDRRLREIARAQGWRPKPKPKEVSYENVALPESIPLPTDDGQNLDYLVNRGIDNETTAYFHLRYCVVGGWLSVDPETKRARIQDFSDRLIIPVYDLDGELRVFQGRDLSGAADQKYLFPKGLPGTGRYLLNGHNAVRAKRVVVGEGAFDVMALKIALEADIELRDVVPIGTFGKHLSAGRVDGEDQLNRFYELRQYGLEEVTIMWDGQRSALQQALVACRQLVGIGLSARVALLPQDCDPNEVSAETVRAAYRGARRYSRTLETQLTVRSPYNA